MPNEREYISSSNNVPLRVATYNIAGNEFRAYYDNADKLVFVVDETITENKPNVLLVINPVGNRKWDDILANDYGLDLEIVRPKKDNKYQKLDIEYAGLATYDNLIRDYETGRDLGADINALDEFRVMSGRRSAAERLAVAESNAEKSRETMAKTNQTIAELQARLKTLRTKLNQQRNDVGKEPTKQSAAKILRTESQIEATNEKLRRAKKRLANAQRRLIAAETDAEIARGILGMEYNAPAPVVYDAPSVPATSAPVIDAPAMDEPVIDMTVTDAPTFQPFTIDYTPEFESEPEPEPKAEIMADEEVKPLFDKDPEILDDAIAFKPIEFNTVNLPAEPAPRDVDVYADAPAPAPLEFTPPVARERVEYVDDAPTAPVTPVLETITPVVTESAQPAPIFDSIVPVAPELSVIDTPAPDTVSDNSNKNPADIAPAAPTSDLRPISPVGDARPPKQSGGRPTFIYYLMLIILIALSIFTLWLYQKKMGDTAPDLSMSAAPEIVAPQPDVPDVSAPNPFDFVETNVVETVTDTTPVVEIAEPEPIAPADDMNVVADIAVTENVPDASVESDELIMESDVMGEPIMNPVAPIVPAPAAAARVNPNPVVNKPAYNVSQHDKMFVAADDYENVNGMCDDGDRPDMYGCCDGEAYTDMGDGTYACCTIGTGECFPPM